MTNTNKPQWIEQSECLNRGGHFWNHYDSHHPHDGYGNMDSSMRYAIDGNPREYRKCGLCGRNEIKIPAKWEEQNNG